MSTQETTDADFFALVHHVLEAQNREPGVDRRDNRRQPYSQLQYVAPLGDERLPKAEDFAEILCYDLSPTGFSFLAAEPPHFEHLVVALGVANYTYVTAAVVHQQLLGLDGPSPYLIGCRFISRLNMPGGGPLTETKATRA
jgi:hypothetical protein